jgi:hypothetical protein
MALSDLFAPAYIRSDPNSVQAVQDWQNQNFGMTNQGVEATRHPVGFNTGNPAGMVDPEALRQLAQGGPRNAIAAQAVAAPAAAPAAPAVYSGYNPYAGTGWWPVFVQNVGQDAAMNWVGQHLGGL